MQRNNSRLMSGAGIAALAVLAIGVTPPVALAQTETAPQAGPDAGIEEIVVTTRKREEKLQDVPVTVTCDRLPANPAARHTIPGGCRRADARPHL